MLLTQQEKDKLYKELVYNCSNNYMPSLLGWATNLDPACLNSSNILKVIVEVARYSARLENEQAYTILQNKITLRVQGSFFYYLLAPHGMYYPNCPIYDTERQGVVYLVGKKVFDIVLALVLLERKHGRVHRYEDQLFPYWNSYFLTSLRFKLTEEIDVHSIAASFYLLRDFKRSKSNWTRNRVDNDFTWKQLLELLECDQAQIEQSLVYYSELANKLNLSQVPTQSEMWELLGKLNLKLRNHPRFSR